MNKRTKNSSSLLNDEMNSLNHKKKFLNFLEFLSLNSERREKKIISVRKHFHLNNSENEYFLMPVPLKVTLMML